MDAMLVVDMQVGLLNGEPFGCPFLFFLVFQGIRRGIDARCCRCVHLIPSDWQGGKMKLAFALTDTGLRSVKPRAAPFKLADGGGLYALIRPNGSVLWRYNYVYGGKAKTLALGQYPA
jgi:hypothetical protein